MDNRRSLVMGTCNDRMAVENICENLAVRADIFEVLIFIVHRLAVKSAN